MITRGLGMLLDPPGTERGVEIGHLVGASPHVPERIDLTSLFTRPHIAQRGQSCVGAKLAYCLELHGCDASYLAPYAIARETEMVSQGAFRDAEKHVLPDVGCYPHRALEALEDWGICSRVRWDDDADLTAPVPADVLEAGSHAYVTGIYRMQTRGAALGREIRAALGQGHAVFCGSLIDEAYRRGGEYAWHLTSGSYTGRRGPSIGGHAWCIVGYETAPVRRFKLRESWGSEWSSGGDAWVDEGWVVDGETFSFTVLTSAPTERLR